MAHESILAVEDDEDILQLLKYNLTKEGYRVTGVTSGEEGLQIARSSRGSDPAGSDASGSGRAGSLPAAQDGCQNRQVSIIMLTAKGEETDIVTGLELGADDYITKPFSTRVLWLGSGRCCAAVARPHPRRMRFQNP